MKAEFISYIIFLPLSPVGREGSESWIKLLEHSGRRGRRSYCLGRMGSFLPRPSGVSLILSSGNVIKCFNRVCAQAGLFLGVGNSVSPYFVACP
jgi:hypothetical protein